MQGVTLDIRTQDATLAIRTRNASIEIRQQMATFRAKVRPAKMHIQSEIPRFSVDRSAFEAQMNNRSVLGWIRTCAQESKTAALQGVGRIAREGDRLMKIYDRSQTIAAIVASRAGKSVSINVAAALDPEIQWQKGEMEINWEPHEMRMEWDAPDPVSYDVSAADVDIRLARMPDIQVEARTTGRQMDLRQTGPIRWIV
jgi:hypothetical protein